MSNYLKQLFESQEWIKQKLDEIRIESGVPLAPKSENRGVLPHHVKYNFDKLNVGDSMFYAGDYFAFQRAANAFGRRNGRRIVTRRLRENGEDGVRVWRLS